MPIYEYQCEGCGEVFEETQKISDPPLKKHAACGSKKVKKLISSTSFQLKGSGWYVTDYKKPSASAKKDSEDTSSDKSETKADTKTESKTETKAAAKSDDTKVDKKKPKKAG
jgi:putative FmdB family regulatory protein